MGTSVAAAADAQGRSDWKDTLGRVGLVGKGVLYSVGEGPRLPLARLRRTFDHRLQLDRGRRFGLRLVEQPSSVSR